jgi:YVTN family beta-propeller protein
MRARRGDGTVSLIDAATNTVTTTIEAGPEPDGMAVDPSTHAVYVADFADATVRVISPPLPVPVITVSSSARERFCPGTVPPGNGYAGDRLRLR